MEKHRGVSEHGVCGELKLISDLKLISVAEQSGLEGKGGIAEGTRAGNEKVFMCSVQ